MGNACTTLQAKNKDGAFSPYGKPFESMAEGKLGRVLLYESIKS